MMMQYAVRSLVLAHGIHPSAQRIWDHPGDELTIVSQGLVYSGERASGFFYGKTTMQMQKMACELVHSPLQIFYSVGPVEERYAN